MPEKRDSYYKFPRIAEKLLEARDKIIDALGEKLSELVFGPNQYDDRIRQALPYALRPTPEEIARGVAFAARSSYAQMPQPIDIKPYQGYQLNPEFAAEHNLTFDPLAFSKNHPTR